MSPAHTDMTAAILPDFADSPAVSPCIRIFELSVSSLEQVNLEVAIAVAQKAIDEGVARVSWSKEELRRRAEDARWEPVYSEYVYDEDGES